jgi:predicted permease
MSWLTRIRNVFRARSLSAELDDELHFHIAERIDDLVASGMREDEARRQAARSFGNYTIQKERTRDTDVAGWLEAFVGDLRHGARQFRSNRGFATVAILSLALGIGANSAIFQLINALRLRSLPVGDPEELVAVDAAENFFASGWREGRHPNFTYAQLEQITAQQQAFSDLMAFATTRFNLSRGGRVQFAEGLFVTPNFLDVLGVAPVLGSWLSADTDPYDCSEAGALLDYRFWQREFGGDPNAVGRGISLNGHIFPILAVAPPSFVGPEGGRRFDVAVPICADGIFARDGRGRLASKTAWWLTPIGRLKPDWSVERASAHLYHISPAIFRASLPEAYRPDAAERYLENRLRAVSARAGVSSIRRGYESPLWILFAITGLVLLIACANLANLLLARASAREREIALRQAIGASRRRLVAQLMAESFLLAGIGTVLGAFLAYILGRGLVAFLTTGEQPLHVPLAVDWRVFGFLATLALLTCALFGLTPALRATKTAPADTMRGGRGSVSGSERHALRRGLVVSQVALSFILLVAALLFGRSLRNLLRTDTGFDSDGVLVATINAAWPNVEPERRPGLFGQLQERIAYLPGVASAAAVQFVPFSGNGWNEGVYADDGEGRVGTVWFNRISPGYLETMRTPLLAGRDFDDHDGPASPNVAIVNEKLARDLFDGSDPIGRMFRYEANLGEADPIFQVVGVVNNTKYNGLREETRPIAFLPLAQDEGSPDELSFVVRARGTFSDVMSSVEEHMAQLDQGLLVSFRMLDVDVEQSVLRERLMASLSGGFGLLAALLSTLGLYGVMSYMVARRRNEIGVRLALGAARGDILGLILREAVLLLVIGLAVGMAGSFALSRYVESLLFGMNTNDAASLTFGSALLALTGLAAALLPALRAARFHPARILQDE